MTDTSNEMRAPQIRIRTHKAVQRRKVMTQNTGCAVCKEKPCQDELKSYICDRLTRSITKLMKELNDIIIYETYRCMPLLGDEKVHAPDWEEHIVREYCLS